MLIELVVEELGVIERAELSLEAGSAALTGETGAGKTLLVVAFGLLMGGRADKDLVRRGAPQSRVEGRFLLRPDHPCAVLALQHDLYEVTSQDEDVELILSRVILADGRPSKARINGRIVTATTLAEIGSRLIGIAGQNEHGRVTDPAWQRRILDSAAGPEAVKLSAEVAQAVRAAAAARRQVEELKAGERARSRELDVLRYEIGEIEAVGLQPGEGDRLVADAARLEAAEETASALAEAADHIEGDAGALEQLARAIAALRDPARRDAGLSEVIKRLDPIQIELGDVSAQIARSMVAPDPASLVAMRSRIGDIQRLRRKYGADDDEVLAYLEQARSRTAALESASSQVDELESHADEQYATATRLASRLTELRLQAAKRLKEEVVDRLAALSLPGAVFEVLLEPRELYEGGAEGVVFLFGPDADIPRPLGRAASGGELARIALALHLVTASSEVGTMLFDEVDAGIGGEAARAVGEALAELARAAGIQTLVVTHLPQVAAFADAQYQVSKGSSSGRRVSSVRLLTPEERVDELSRMLAGLPDSERAQEHARELLDVARRPAPAA